MYRLGLRIGDAESRSRHCRASRVDWPTSRGRDRPLSAVSNRGSSGRRRCGDRAISGTRARRGRCRCRRGLDRHRGDRREVRRDFVPPDLLAVSRVERDNPVVVLRGVDRATEHARPASACGGLAARLPASLARAPRRRVRQRRRRRCAAYSRPSTTRMPPPRRAGPGWPGRCPARRRRLDRRRPARVRHVLRRRLGSPAGPAAGGSTSLGSAG